MLLESLRNAKTTFNILQNIPRAKTLRELARLSGVSLSTVQRHIAKLRSVGILKFVPDDAYFGLIRLAVMFSSHREVNLNYRLAPIGTMAIRNFVGVGKKLLLVTAHLPHVFVDVYLSELFNLVNSEVIGVIRAKEYLTWRPDSFVLNAYCSNKREELIKHVYSMLEQGKKPVEYKPNSRIPDSIDLKILSGRLVLGPYGKISDQLAWLMKYYGKKWNITKQTLSYHYRVHVLKGWKFNTFNFYLPHEKVPFSLLYLVGEEAPALARALMIIPHSISAYLEDKAAVMLVQYSDSMQRYLYEVASTAKVEIPYGPFIMKLSLKRYIPPFWRFVNVEGKKIKWKWPEESASKYSLIKNRGKFSRYK